MKRMHVMGLITVLMTVPSLVAAQNTAREVNVRDFAGIQEAVDALVGTGGVVYFPPGEYNITAPIQVRTGEITLRGAGPSTVLRNINTGGGNTLELLGVSQQEERRNPASKIWRIQVRDLHLTGNDQCGHGIYAKGVNETVIQNCWIDYHGNCGVMLDSCYENPRIIDNNIAYNRVAGIHVDGCHDIVISANEMEENGIGIHTSNGFNTTITGNNIDDHISTAILFRNMRGSIVSANMIENGKKAHIILDERSDGTTISGNMLRQNESQPQIWIKSALGVTVAANTIEGCAGFGVRAEPGCGNLTVTGNTFTQIQLVNRPPTRPMDLVFGISMSGVEGAVINGNSLVETQSEGILLHGAPSRYVTISNNTILRPSKAGENQHAGIELENVSDSIISSNTVIDDRPKSCMTFAIRESGASRDNVMTGNRVSSGKSGAIHAPGLRNIVENNLVH